MWTKQQIDILKKYIENNRSYLVKYQEQKVYGIKLPLENWPVTDTAIYLTPYDDTTPDNFVKIGDTQPTDFSVFSLQEIGKWWVDNFKIKYTHDDEEEDAPQWGN